MVMEDNDAAVVERVRAGNTDAFRVLVERHSVALFRLAYRMTGNRQDAEDVVQETFLRAYRHLRRFDARASLAAWLHRVAVNCSINLLNQHQRQSRAGQPAEATWAGTSDLWPAATRTPDREVLSIEVQQQVQAALTQLTPREKAAFVLRHFEGRSIAEISSTLGLRANAAKQNVFRAVQKLRRALEPILNPAESKRLCLRPQPSLLRVQGNGGHSEENA